MFIIMIFTTMMGGGSSGEAGWSGDSNKVFLVLAKVESVQIEQTGRHVREYEVDLRPVATLAGSLDVSTRDLMTVSFTYRDWSGTNFNPNRIAEVPEEGNWVLVALHTVTDYRTMEEQIVIKTGGSLLMPKLSNLAIVSGPGDPAVWETAKRVREARQPATQPATRPVVDE